MKIKTIAIVKHPREKVWATMRDKLPELARFMDDMDSIITESRDKHNGIYNIVNICKAAPKLPDMVVKYLDTNMLQWNDCAAWDEETWKCRWRIEPHKFGERINCHGITSFDMAMGGRGTRVTLESTIEWNDKDLPGIPAFIELKIFDGIGLFFNNIIPKNFQKIMNALSEYLELELKKGKS